jgi:selenocysteine lyase/cysteine desulfurase
VPLPVRPPQDAARRVAAVTLLSGATDRSAPGSTIFEVDGLDALAAVPMIEQRGSAHIDKRQWDGHNAIRISTHVYNTAAEIDRVVAALLAQYALVAIIGGAIYPQEGRLPR